MEVLFLARHAESEASVHGALSGDPSVHVGLTELGVEQARRLGERLADEPIDLCVVTELARTAQTADVALAGRGVPRLVVPELNDPRYGEFEGRLLDAYRVWAAAHASSDEPPGGGESRVAIVRRYVRGFRRVLERPERTILAVLHSLPISYVLEALEGRDPAPRAELVGYAEARPLAAAELERALARLDAWCGAPTW